MAKLFQTLFRGNGGKPSSEISRYDISWYLQQLNNPYALYTGGGTAYRDGRNVEEISHSFTGYIQAAYKANGPIFGIVLARLMLFTEARLAYRRLINGRPGDLFGDDEGGSLSLLQRPWPNGTTGELLARMEQDVSFAGNSYTVNEGDRLRRLRPDWVSIVLSGDPEQDFEVDVVGYAYTPGGLGRGETKVFLLDEVCHWSPIPDPESQYRGMSWLTPVIRELQADQAATEHKSAFFKNGASPRLVVSLKESVREEQFRKFVRAMAESTGGTDQAYKTMYLAGGADVTVAGADLRQLDFRATQGAGETRLCAAGGVPPIIVGLSEGLQAATYSNYASARRKFGDHWARPQWRSACAALASITDVPDGAELWYDDRDIAFLREDQKDAAEIAQIRATTINTYITAGFTPESAVAAVDADDLTLLVHSGMVSVQLQPPGGGVPEDGMPTGDVPPPLDGPATEEDTNALVDAMAELDTAARAWSGAQAQLHPRGPGGKFKSTKDRLVESIEAHLNGGGGAHPFDGFSREQLRRVAKARGIELKKGASRDDISKSLLDSLRGEANPAGLKGSDGAKLDGVRKPKPEPAAAKPQAPEKPAAPKAAETDAPPPKEDWPKNPKTGAAVRPLRASGTPRAVTAEEADALHERMMEGRPWTDSQRAAIAGYTGFDYEGINGGLRSGNESADGRAAVAQIRAGMREIPEDIVVHRGVNARQFGFSGDQIPDGEGASLVGRSFNDPGFSSTSVDRPLDGWVKMRITVPAGTRGTYVESITETQGEHEMLLDRGTHFRITHVEYDEEEDETIMHVTVVGQDE